MTQSSTSNRKQKSGVVVSTKMQKTAVVQIETIFRHPVYGKVVRSYKKYHAHDENSTSVVGDKVVIIESRPHSKLKRWEVVYQSKTK